MSVILNMDIYKKGLEKFLESFFKNSNKINPTLLNSMRYSVMSGGKRIRPILLCAFHELCGGKVHNAYPFAAAVELVHTYSLIHDDLPCMDNDAMRRGKESNHIVYGEDIALLAGDALLTSAFEIMFSKGDGEKIDIKDVNALRAAYILARSAGVSGMISGQAYDLKMSGEVKNKSLTENESILKMYKLKTGAMFAAACAMGAVTAGATKDEENAAWVYGENLGLAFQLTDDIADAEQDMANIDENGISKLTYVSVNGTEKALRMANEFIYKAKDALKVFKGDTLFEEEIANMIMSGVENGFSPKV